MGERDDSCRAGALPAELCRNRGALGSREGLSRDHAAARRRGLFGSAERGVRRGARIAARPRPRCGPLRDRGLESDRRPRCFRQAHHPQAEPDPTLESRGRRPRRDGRQRDHPRRGAPCRRRLRDDRRRSRRQRRDRRSPSDGLRLRSHPRDRGSRRHRARLRRSDRPRARSDRPAPRGRDLPGRDHRRASHAPGRPRRLPCRRPGRSQLLHRLGPRPKPLPRRRLRPGSDLRAPQRRPQRLPAVRDRALR